jgi:hypothetical protein
MNKSDYPLDRVLERLRVHTLPYRWDDRHLNIWHAVCPSCQVPYWTLVVREHGYGGPVDLTCAAGCCEADILTILMRHPAEDRVEAALTREAEAWGIVDELREVAGRAIRLTQATAGGRQW